MCIAGLNCRAGYATALDKYQPPQITMENNCLIMFFLNCRRKAYVRCLLLLGYRRKATSVSLTFAKSMRKENWSKDQRAMAKDLKVKPTIKPVYIRCLHGLDIVDRLALLKKVLYYVLCTVWFSLTSQKSYYSSTDYTNFKCCQIS